MKNLMRLMFLLVAGITLAITACKKDKVETDVKVNVTQDRAIGHLGDTIPLSISATTSNDEIQTVTMTKTGGVAVEIPAVTNNKNYATVKDYIVTDSVGTLVFTISTRTTLSSDPIVKTLTYSIVKDVEITMGTTASALPGYINGSTLTLYNTAAANANQDKIDLVCTYSATDGMVIGSPSDPVFNLTGWTVKNSTKIGKIMDESPEAVSMVTGSSVKNLEVDDMLGYVSSTGVQGIIEVMSITPGNDGNTEFVFMVIK
jgi:hypothetical protein